MTNPPGDGPTEPSQDPQQPHDRPGYWQQPPPPPSSYGQPPYYGGAQPPYYGGAQPPYRGDHPKATTSLVLGILGIVLCQVLAPFAWVIGKRTVTEIDASQGTLGGRGSAQAGYVLGIVGSVLLGLTIAFLIVVMMLAVVGGTTSTMTMAG